MKKILAFILLSFLFNEVSLSSTSLNFELGQAQNTFNQVRIDSESGTKFNLVHALESTSYYRLNLIQTFKSGNGIRLLYAPLKFSGHKTFSHDINFNGVNFSAGDKIQAQYQFNSYRGTYFKELISKRNLLLRLGGTLKIRDAFIELKQEDRKKAKKNIGVVPLVYLYSKYKWDNNFLLTLDFDGLIAPQGRAFDVALSLGYFFSPVFQFDLGFRMLEGGVDNEKVYNFSQVNYYFTAVQFNF